MQTTRSGIRIGRGWLVIDCPGQDGRSLSIDDAEDNDSQSSVNKLLDQIVEE